MVSLMKELNATQDFSLKCSVWEKDKVPDLVISKNNQHSFRGVVSAHRSNKCIFALVTDIFPLLYFGCLFRPNETTCMSELISSE